MLGETVSLHSVSIAHKGIEPRGTGKLATSALLLELLNAMQCERVYAHSQPNLKFVIYKILGNKSSNGKADQALAILLLTGYCLIYCMSSP